jgi:hypothetical protein
MKIDWAKKLASRKFWIALSALICALCVLFGVDNFTIEKLTATITALGVLAAYILTEGYIDAKSIEKTDEKKTE